VFTGRSDVVVPARRAVPVRRIVTRVDVDAAGHCGIVAHPEVISRIVAATAPATPPVTAPVAELAARAA
jgi:pimeloyl-ACP methyl ester carboxylesterase